MYVLVMKTVSTRISLKFLVFENSHCLLYQGNNILITLSSVGILQEKLSSQSLLPTPLIASTSERVIAKHSPVGSTGTARGGHVWTPEE